MATVAFDHEGIVEALSQVGEILYQQGKIGDISVFGGTAMILQFDLSFVTQDVDALITDNHGAVMSAVQAVARRNGWNSTWLNEGVSVYLSQNTEKHVSLFGSFPSEARCGLRVYVAKPEYLIALKLKALRVGSRDIEDVLTLAKHLGLSTLNELLAIVESNLPGEKLDARQIVVAGTIAERLTDAAD